jgi:4,5-dihydroxyphthalate decarboxylase
MQPLTFALGNYGVTKPIKAAGANLGRLNLRFVEVEQIVPMMRRMCRGLEFDICEMAFTTYLCARAAGLPFTAIPVFVTRNFHHWAVFINTRSGIKGPKDLEGRKVGVNRGYTVTTGLWARGILHSEYGVDLNKVTWIPTDDEHVAGFAAPKNVDYRFRGAKMRDLLLSGEIDAAIGEVAVDVPEIQPLIPDAQNAAFGYFRKTGIYPINHGVVVKDSVLKDAPWIVDELCRAFEAAKAEYLKNLDMDLGATATSWDKAAKANADVVGDPYPFGIEPNRKALEAMTRFAADQGMVPRKYSVEELFVPPG